jgi:putative thioredoxin
METIIGGQTLPDDVIKNSDAGNFVADVIEASRLTPVVVDFWAPWCEPCKQLGPQIEKAVKDRAGDVKLVKINVDENQEIAAQLQVQSIPAVFAFKDGKPVDGFVGAQPESQIKAFIDRIAGDSGPSPIEVALEEAASLMAESNYAKAQTIFEQVIAHDPSNYAAVAGAVRCHVSAGQLAEGRALLNSLDLELHSQSEIAGAIAALELAEETASLAGTNTDLTQLQAKLEANPVDHKTRYDLACALWGDGQRDKAISELLAIVKQNREWNGAAARKQLLKYFDAMGPTDPLTIEARGQLSSLLFS